MDLVVDSNIIFAALISEGRTRSLIFDNRLSLFVPAFFREEAKKYAGLLSEKSSLDEWELESALEMLLEKVNVVPAPEYAVLKDDALMVCPDASDWPFFALALKMDCGIWSQDKKLKEQARVKVLNTKELIGLLEVLPQE